MATCEVCKYGGTPSYKSPCSECKGFSKYKYNPEAQDKEGKGKYVPTNADRIRAMSDEELADWLTEFGVEIYTAGVIKVPALMTKEERFDWLQQPVEE